MALTLTVETGAGLAAANPDREKPPAMATRFLDGNVRWEGNRKTAEQALAWPREDAYWDGHEVPDDTVPGPVKAATAELAGLLLATDLQAEQAADNVSEIGLGQSALVVRFKDSSKTRRMPIAIGELLQGLGHISGAGGINTRPVVRR